MNFSKPTVKPFPGQTSTISIQFLSDIHLDRLLYQHVPIEPAAPILLLIGDIGRFDDYDQYRDFLVHQSAHYEKAILVAGNHEFYSSSRTEGLEAAERLVREQKMNSKLLFLNQARFDVPNTNVTILGCSLHSPIAPDYTKLTHDFARIKDWRVADHNSEHERDLAWLKSSIAACSNEQPQRRKVVATHYAPAFEKTAHPATKTTPSANASPATPSLRWRTGKARGMSSTGCSVIHIGTPGSNRETLS
ncbi:hypothetical protein KC315_g3327 [Hortaea werneckii]|nr:hypothetical protein KC315_g3327 [Hortaea werneckii]